jgi:uncharacterized protein (DUF1499 family)
VSAARDRLPALALGVAALAVVLLAAAGPLTRFGVWHFRTGLGALKYAAYLGMAGAALGLAALAARPARRAVPAAALALVLGAATALLPWRQLQAARRLPPIHDVTTDLTDPPAFVAVLPLRAGAPNKAEYGGDSVAAQQRRGYPDLGPLRLDAPPPAAFARAAAAARAMGWEVVAADAAAGRVEATATTRWFGFKDDVVVRVRPDGAGSRVDVRSVSRVGGSDVGANAARIRAYLARVRDAA